jgi:effector-binding domain-containing protein
MEKNVLEYNRVVNIVVCLKVRSSKMSKYESLSYEVICKNQAIEIRRYDAYQTVAVNENDLSGRSGFGVLFSYISGNNEKNEKIAMTIPVINAFDSKNMTMEFVVPKKYQNENTPRPNEANVNIKTYKAHDAAVITFSGRATNERIEQNTKLLKDFLEDNQINHNDVIRLARYNSPFQLPVLRRNEILIEIETFNVK